MRKASGLLPAAKVFVAPGAVTIQDSAAARVLAAATDFRDVLRVPAILAAILVIVRDRAIATRMRASLIVNFVCHLNSLLSLSSVKDMGAVSTSFASRAARRSEHTSRNESDAFIRLKAGR
jgi:hypothetical protein